MPQPVDDSRPREQSWAGKGRSWRCLLALCRLCFPSEQPLSAPSCPPRRARFHTWPQGTVPSHGSQVLSWSLPTYNHDVEVETRLHGFLAHLLNYGVNTDVAQQAGVDAHGFHWYNWFLSWLWDQFRHGCFVFALHWSCMGTKIEKSSLRWNNSLPAHLSQGLRTALTNLFKGY